MNKVVLSSIIEIISGGTPKTSVAEYWNGDIGWLSVTDFNNDNRFVYETEKTITEKGVKESNTKFLNKGDIIISARGTVGALAQIGKPMCFNQSCFGIRGKKNLVSNDYLYYVLKNYVKNIVLRSQGSVFNTINLASFDLMELNIHSDLPTQRSIAKVLSDLDAKIELNNKINRELEAMAKTLYDYWFVQFDFPTPPSSTSGIVGKPYKSSGGKMVYNAELKREIPEGWEVKNLFKSCIVQYGFPFSTEYFNSEENGVPVIRIRDILDNTISNYSTEKKLDEKYLIKKGDLLIGMDGNFHINYWSKNECYLNQRVVKLSETILPNIILKYQIEPYIKLREKSVSRTTVGHLSDKDLKALNLFIPSKEVLASVSPLFNKTLNRIIQTQNENQQLSALRDWLLPMLMNGQVASRASATEE